MYKPIDIYERFSKTQTIDQLWGAYKDILDAYGFTSVMYCVSHAATIMQHEGFESAWYKCDHPDDYRAYFDEEFHIDDDHTALHCIKDVTPYVWSDPAKFEEQNENQKRFMLESCEFGMGSGVTLPLRFAFNGVGGVGLNAGNLSEKEFNTIWQNYSTQIIMVSRIFDEFARSQNIEGMYSLSNREQEVLTWLTAGKKTEQIAEKIGTAVSTIEKQIRSARKKLNARNNEQAVAKAITFNLIKP